MAGTGRPALRDIFVRGPRCCHPLRTLVLLAVAVHVVVPVAGAQVTGDVPPYVLRMPASVRGVALGGAGAALVGDAGAVFANPAGLATIHHIALDGGYRTAPGGAWLATGSLGWRLSQFDIGVGGRYFNLGDDPTQYVGPGAAPGTNTREALGVASLVYRFGILALGVSGKYARRSVDSVHVRGFSGDAGIAVAFFDIMAFGFGVQNISGNWRRSSALAMPRLTRLGFTMNYIDPQESFRLLSILEVEWPEGEDARWVVGGEAGVVVSGIGLIGRVGFGGEYSGLPNSHVSLGATLALSAVSVDYAYRHRDLLDRSVHHFGLRVTL